MLAVVDLPTEIVWGLLELCPRELRGVNRRFYLLHNELYREKAASLVVGSAERREKFWSVVRGPMVDYVRSLDFLRGSARRIAGLQGEEYVDDSWYIIYNALLGPLRCGNHAGSVRDSLDYHKPIFSGGCVVSPGQSCAVNAWFYIDDLEAARKLATLVTEFRGWPYENYSQLSTVLNIADFIKKTGLYCFRLGRLPKMEGRTTPVSMELRLVERSMTPPDYFEKPQLEFLGYDFNDYDSTNKWLFFRVDSAFRNTVFNPYETMLCESLVKWDGKFDLPSHCGNLPDVSPGYFDPDVKAVREFTYRYPKSTQNMEAEKHMPDWRAPRLRH